MTAHVVSALQSPTLLNIWASSECWRLEVAPLGDHDLEESRLMRVPLYETGTPDIVLVCSPLQLERACETWPNAKRVWVHHNARVELFPLECQSRVDHRLALAESIADVVRGSPPEPPVSVIVPCYTPERRFRWRPDLLWTMMSRPETRHEDHLRMMSATVTRLGELLTVYGENQTAGFLLDADKAALIESSSAYLSCLPPWSGFGLAEHEMFASGVPVIGPRWADIVTEMPEEYLTLTSGIDASVLAARLLARCRECAEQIGDMGLAFIADRRTKQRMESGIQQFLERLL